MKTCKQCGDMKPLKSFRMYYGGRKGHYKTCLTCERINNKHKYLSSKVASGTASVGDAEELAKIEELWEAQRELGLQPPRTQQPTSDDIDLDATLARYKTSAEKARAEAPDEPKIPDELEHWLSVKLTEEPDYYLDTVYDELKAKYRPILKVDGETLLPVYDETYKQALDTLLQRFYDYEDGHS